MSIWLWDSVALHYSAPPSRAESWHPVKTVTHLKTFEYIGHLETR